MRILHVPHCLPPNGDGGVQTYTLLLARTQAAAGHDVAIYTRGTRRDVPEGTEETVTRFPGLTVIESHLGARHQYATLRARPLQTAAFTNFLCRFQPDVVHLHHLLYLSLDFPAAARAAGAAVLMTVHDLYLVCPTIQRVDFRGELCRRPVAKTCLPCVWNGRRAQVIPRETILWLASTPAVAGLLDLAPTVDDLEDWTAGSLRCLDAVDTLIGPSRFVLDNLREHGVTHPRAVVLDNGVGRPEAPVSRPADAPLRFGFLGTHRLKGPGVVLDAFRTLADIPDIRLECYGGGVGGVGALPANVVDHGRFDPAEMVRVYASFDVLIVPSIWWENAPVVIREAFARGIPVIASDLGGMAESVRDGVDGLLFPVGDAAALASCVRRLHDDPGLFDALRAGVRPPLFVEEHRARLDELYTAAMARRDGPPAS
jgi:glycosyltransferase involved in cell wall biosynthesis